MTAGTAESQTSTSQATTTFTQNASSSEGFSWLSWILGETPLAQDVQEANFVSTQLDQLINDALQVEQEIEERSVTIRRRRSPDETTSTTSPSESTWYANLWQWLRGTQISNGDADFQSDQLNKEITNALGSPNEASQGPTSKTNTKDAGTINGKTPIEVFKDIMPDGGAEDVVVGIHEWWNDPENTGYVRAIVIMWKVIAFVTPGLGIIEQINFTVACTKLIWKTAKMYCEGSDISDITVAVLPDLAYLVFMVSSFEVLRFKIEGCVG